MSQSAQFGFNLHDAARLLRRDFDRRARQLGLSRSRWQILWHLSKHEGTHQAGLAEVLDVAPISLARQLDRLQQEGLIERRPDASDRRCYRLHLTDQARPMLTKMQELAVQTRAVALAGFSEQEVDHLVEALSRVRSNLSG
jgi:DNA-binding MarR family transcriptional regulator